MLKKQILAVLCMTILFNLFGGETILAASITMPVTGWPLSFWQKPDTATDLTEGGTGVAITGDSAWVPSGRGALHVWTEKSISNLNAQAVQQIAAFTEGEKYHLTGKLYLSSSSWGFGLYLGNTRLTMLRDIVTYGQWADVDYTFTFTGSSKDFKLQVAQIGFLYADDLSLKKVIYDGETVSGYGPELLMNGNFEADFAPAGEVSSLAAVEGDAMAQLTWTNPSDANLQKILIYNGTVLLKEVSSANSSAVIDGLENGMTYQLTVKTQTSQGVLSSGVTVSVKPFKKLPLPKVIKDDEENRIIGLTEEMQYSFDEGKNWTVYHSTDPLDLSGDVTVWLRMYSGEAGTEAPVQILHFTANPAGNDEIKIEKAKIKGNTFLLSGSLNRAAQTNVTVLVVKTGQNRRTLSAVLAVGEGKSDANGKFSFAIPVADQRNGQVNDGEYTLYVDSGLTGDITYDGLVFANSTLRKAALAALWTETDLKPLFETGSNYSQAYRAMGFPLNEYSSMTAGKEKVVSDFKVLLTSVDKNAANAEDLVAAAFTEAYLMSAMQAADADKAYFLLKQYGAELGLRYSEAITWEALAQIGGGEVSWISQYMAGKSYTGVGSLNKRFCEAYALYLINQSTYGNMAAVIAAQKDILSLSGSDYDRYMAMKDGSEEKTDTSKAIVLAKYRSPFTNGDEVLAAIKAGLPASGGGTGSGSGGSSSGGSGGTRTDDSGLTMLGVPSAPTAQEQSQTVFSDLSNVPWAQEGIGYLYQKGIVKGDGNGSFYPENLVTREEFVSILVNAFGLTDSASTASFEDVPDTQWYYRAVASAVSAGVAGGMGEGIFGTGQNITREDLAVMAYRCMVKQNRVSASEDQKLSFTDGEQVSGYAEQAVSAMGQLGIIKGYADGSFGPKNSATRAETAKIIYAILMLGEGM